MSNGEQTTISNASANRMALFAATGVVDLIVALRRGQDIDHLTEKLAMLADCLGVYGVEDCDELFAGFYGTLRNG